MVSDMAGWLCRSANVATVVVVLKGEECFVTGEDGVKRRCRAACD